MMPGQASDAPGRVMLVDKTGHVLQATDVAMVQLVEGVDWSWRKATIAHVVTWDIPEG
jgi:hypothetical protein